MFFFFFFKYQKITHNTLRICISHALIWDEVSALNGWVFLVIKYPLCIFIAISFGDNLYSYFPTRHVFILSDHCKDVRVSRITSWFALKRDASAGGALELVPPTSFLSHSQQTSKFPGWSDCLLPCCYFILTFTLFVGVCLLGRS